MGLFTKQFLVSANIDIRTEERILEFLNGATSAAAIAGVEPQVGPVLDDPNYQRSGYDIGEVVAERILIRRASLGGKFSSILEVSEVGGVGVDKLKDLAYTFGPRYTRKHALSLSTEEWESFIRAIAALVANDRFAGFAAIHAEMGYDMHYRMLMDGEESTSETGRHRFLSWHRAFLHEFEKVLRSIDDSVTIPFWDWVNQREIPPEMEDVTGTAIEARSPDVAFWLPDVSSMNGVLNHDNYEDFTASLESGPHDRVHSWVDGDMANLNTAARDPIFWLHHANVDRYWHYWQQWHPDEDPSVEGDDRILDPWTDLTVDSVKHCSDLDYTYESWPIEIPKSFLESM